MGRIANDNKRIGCMQETININKKIIFRFLKEMGILTAWECFVHSNKLNDNIYCKKYPDNIFSSLRFTYFLRTKYKLHLNCSITNLFRLYASYHKIKVANKIMPEHYVKALMDVDIDKKTNIFKFKETIYA